MGDSIIWLLGVCARELTMFAAIGLLVGGIDDLTVDLLWIGRAIRRRLFVYSRHPRMTMASLPPPREPGRIAILIAAWRESEVIGPMLRTALARIEHDDYLIYVGTYPNDPATQAAVRDVGDGRVRLVDGILPGPTTKAECLNRAWSAMRLDERATGRRVKAVVLHDAEDVVHPLELRLYDRMIERFDLVQVPVLPLASPGGLWAHAVSATYADEFAEAHGKQLILREAVGASVPSAGTGCAIARDMLDRIARANGGLPFDADSLTEDYELGLKIKALGGQGAFVVMPTAPGRPPVAVRAHFPDKLKNAVRQKTRWITGIALAGWDRMRWDGGLAERWMRLRDRRALLAALVIACAYAAIPLVSAAHAAGIDIAWPSVFRWLLPLNLALLGWRIGMRALMTARVYGWRQGVAAILRMPISNFIEVAAATCALLAYVPGRLPRWDKTSHHFPEEVPCD